MVEIWKAVVGVRGYEVSSFGRVRRSLSGSRTKIGRIRKPVTRPSGYQFICMSVEGRRIFRRVHRLVLEAFVGPCPVGMETRHLNGDSADNRRQNLKWGTRFEQRQDDIKNGVSPRGERHSMAKLTAVQVKEIRERYVRGDLINGGTLLAAEFGVSQPTISNVVNLISY